MELIYFLGAIQSFFWVLLILNKKQKQLPDIILSMWLMVIGCNILLIYFQYTEYDYRWWPHGMGINAGLPNLHGPMLLLYIQFQQQKYDGFKPVLLLHLIPFITTNLLLVPQYMMSKSELIYWIEHIDENAPLNLIVNELLISFSGVFYIAWSWIELRRHRKKVGHYYSYIQHVNLHWLRNLILGLGIIWIVVLFSEYIFWLLPDNTQDIVTGSAIIYILASIFVFYIGFYGIKQGVIFGMNASRQAEIKPVSKEKYQRSGLNEEKAEALGKRLLEVMTQEKPYLASRLTLAQLAVSMEVPQNHLSQVINDKLGSNFYEFINRYRISEFKERIQSDSNRNLTILGHALESGFSSKSTFNDIFKKMEGMTPSSFSKTLK